MPTYGYVPIEGSNKRGYNKSVRVYKIVNNKPKMIGSGDFQSAGWAGFKGETMHIIAKKEGYKMNPRGYGFVRKDIDIVEL